MGAATAKMADYWGHHVPGQEPCILPASWSRGAAAAKMVDYWGHHVPGQ